jgi:hypothetical protein
VAARGLSLSGGSPEHRRCARQLPSVLRRLAAACVLLWACSTGCSTGPETALADAGRPKPSDSGTHHRRDAARDSAFDARVDSTADATVDVEEPNDSGEDSPLNDSGDAGPGDANPDALDSGFDTGCVPLYPDASAQGFWQPVAQALPAAAPPFSTSAMLLTDGSVIVGLTWRLTPDIHGSYVNGTWAQIAPLPAGYNPRWFASAVLADGRLLVEGGEWNGLEVTASETPLGAIFDPLADTWTSVAPPVGWYVIGDSPSVVMPNGDFMVGGDSNLVNPSGLKAQALLVGWSDAGSPLWTATGATDEAEVGWNLLPNGQVLEVDCFNGTESELYLPDAGLWVLAGDTPVRLVDTNNEIGPSILMNDGRVLATGATGHTAIYSAQGTWSAGPDMPVTTCGQIGIPDGPAALLPNGHVLMAASPIATPPDSGFAVPYAVEWMSPTYFLEFDGTSIAVAAAPPAASSQPCNGFVLLLLPTGQVMEVGATVDVAIYTSVGSPDAAWAPAITSVPPTVSAGGTYAMSGTQFNGLSQAVAYGDDFQAATNYPLVRITNDATGDVVYARTHDHSTMGVATGSKPVSTFFDVPVGAETGPSHVVVVANGIPSPAVAITVEPPDAN